MTDHPRIPEAPGLDWRKRAFGWEARWKCRADLARRGFRPSVARLWIGADLDDIARAWLIDRCVALQREMLIYGRGGLPEDSPFDGTLLRLSHCYQTDADSTFRKIRHATRENYGWLLRRLEKDHGAILIAEVKARTLLRWHEDWGAGGKVALAHGLVGMLRTLCTFGATILEDGECIRLSAVLHKMRFPMLRPRKERLTAEQATDIRAAARADGRPSIALGQALQFELMLRQRDVIGEWVPIAEPGTSEWTCGGSKWLRGLRWSEIDAGLILRHTTSKKGKDIEVDLRLAPMVMEELARYEGKLPASGPMIVDERRGHPYHRQEYRRLWRLYARRAGVPDAVFNMDSRAGGITEATDAGADLEHVRHAATHSDIGMTQKYSRGGVQKTATVMQLRSAHRERTKK